MDPCNTPETILYTLLRVQVSIPLPRKHPKPEALDYLEGPGNSASRLMMGIPGATILGFWGSMLLWVYCKDPV